MNRYITPIIFLLLAGGLYVLYIDPSYQQIKRGIAREEELKNHLIDAGTAQEKINALKMRYESFPAGADQSLRALLPDAIDPTRLIVDMNAVVERRGLVMKGPSVSLKGQNSESGVVAHQVSFNVSAPYTVFRELLRDLEASLALRDIADVSFDSVGGSYGVSPELVVHSYNLNLTTYSLSQ